VLFTSLTKANNRSLPVTGRGAIMRTMRACYFVVVALFFVFAGLATLQKAYAAPAAAPGHQRSGITGIGTAPVPAVYTACPPQYPRCHGPLTGTFSGPFTAHGAPPPFTRAATPAHQRARATATTKSVDMRNYMSVPIANANGTGNMLCSTQSGYSSYCLTSFYDGNQYGETKISYGIGNGIIDYIAISSNGWQGSANYIGVARNLPGTGGQLRCFANVFENCTAPVNTVFMPEGVPYLISNLPGVSLQTELASENPDGSPAAPIAGSIITTQTVGYSPYKNYQPFGVNSMNGQCAQSLEFDTYNQTRIVYVTSVPFGGTIGTQDAIVIDGFGIGPPNHIERYFYVKGLGRVREATAFQGSDGKYNHQTQNIYHNVEEPLSSKTININGGGCPQGSAVPLY